MVNIHQFEFNISARLESSHQTNLKSTSKAYLEQTHDNPLGYLDILI